MEVSKGISDKGTLDKLVESKDWCVRDVAKGMLERSE